MVALTRQFEVRGPMYHQLLRPFLEGRWKDIPREQCWWGPAGTAKTMSTFIVLDTILRDPRFEGVRVLWLRKTLQSCRQSSLVTFEERVLHPQDPIKKGKSREYREAYIYRRKGRRSNELVVCGMNEVSRLFGTEYDIVVAEEAIEFTEAEVESLWRAMRNPVLPFKTLIMLTNPDSQFHWLYQRMRAGRTESFFVGIECNPRFYDLRLGKLTADGIEFLQDMKAQMQDERYARMVEGRWVSAQGVILKTFGRRHLIDAELVREPGKWPQLVPTGEHPVFKEPIELRWFFASMDFGDRSPGCIEVWGVTAAGMLVRVAEVYQSDRDINWWARWCADLYGEFMLRAIVCDSSRPKEIDVINDLIARQYMLVPREEANEHGEKRMVAPRIAVGVRKNTQKQTDQSNVVLLRYAFGLDDGRPRILLVRDVERVIDAQLLRDRKPMGLIEEIPGWTWAKHDPNRHVQAPREEADPHREDHAIDATAYAIAYAWGRDLSRDPSKFKPATPPGSYAHMRQFIPWRDKAVKDRIKEGR